MTGLRRSDVLLILAGMGALVLLFLLVFDRYVYDDYATARCDAGRRWIRAELVGDFGRERPTVRGAPYYLRLEIERDRTAAEASTYLRRAALTSLSSGKHRSLGAGDRHWNVKGASGVVVFLFQDLKLPYEGYRLSGEFVTDGSAEGFSCIMRTKRWTEWRIPWIDMLMSV